MCGFRLSRVLGHEATVRRLHLHARMCIHIAAASSSALSHSVVPLVTKMHVDERTGICLLLLLKSLCLHGRRHSAVVSLRACVLRCLLRSDAFGPVATVRRLWAQVFYLSAQGFT